MYYHKKFGPVTLLHTHGDRSMVAFGEKVELVLTSELIQEQDFTFTVKVRADCFEHAQAAVESIGEIISIGEL